MQRQDDKRGSVRYRYYTRVSGGRIASPHAWGRKEVWIGDRGRVTYGFYNNPGFCNNPLGIASASDPTLETTLEATAAILWRWPQAAGASELLWYDLWRDGVPPARSVTADDIDVIDVELEETAERAIRSIPEQPILKQIGRRLRSFSSRVRAALRAAWQELSRVT